MHTPPSNPPLRNRSRVISCLVIESKRLPYIVVFRFPLPCFSSLAFLTMKIITLFAWLALMSTTAVVVVSATECEVCVKVMDDVRAAMSKEDSRNKDKIEVALGDFCANVSSNREKKLCYYIDPIKRQVAQPFSTGMPSLKVCKRLAEQNPEICTVKFPVTTKATSSQDLSKLRVKQLKAILGQRGVECKGCVEKEEFIRRVQETSHLEGQDL